MMLNNDPSGVHMSNQKLISFPFPTEDLRKFAASGLSFQRDLQVHEFLLVSATAQNEVEWRWWCLCQVDHGEQLLANSVQMNLRHKVLFLVEKLLRPNPPSFLGRQTCNQATLALRPCSIFPVHRNLAQKASIFLMQPFGRRKVEIQKLTVPEMTVAINWVLPTKERVFTDHDLNLLAILAFFFSLLFFFNPVFFLV